MKKTKKIGLEILKCLLKIACGLAGEVLLAYFFPIHADYCYSWTGGFWHGYTWVGNWILSLFNDGRLLLAPCHTNAYKVWFWISLGLLIIWFAKIIIGIIAFPIIANLQKKHN